MQNKSMAYSQAKAERVANESNMSAATTQLQTFQEQHPDLVQAEVTAYAEYKDAERLYQECMSS